MWRFTACLPFTIDRRLHSEWRLIEKLGRKQWAESSSKDWVALHKNLATQPTLLSRAQGWVALHKSMATQSTLLSRAQGWETGWYSTRAWQPNPHCRHGHRAGRLGGTAQEPGNPTHTAVTGTELGSA